MSERTPRFLWMEVSKDEYELPLAVADSALELAKVLGLKDENSVISSVSRAKRGGYWCKYKRVPLSERVGDLMEDEVILMSPPGATGSKRHRFCKVEHNGKSYWVDLTATRRLRGIDSARLYTLKDGRLIVARLVRVSVLRSQGVI